MHTDKDFEDSNQLCLSILFFLVFQLHLQRKLFKFCVGVYLGLVSRIYSELGINFYILNE
jgi:hypothetical protein